MRFMERALAAGLVLLLGCGGDADSGDDAQGTASSCDLTADVGYCLDFGPEVAAGTAQGNCDGAEATLGYMGVVMEDGACPSADRVGTCDAVIGGVALAYRYYSPTWDTAEAEENCMGLADGGGEFTPD